MKNFRPDSVRGVAVTRLADIHDVVIDRLCNNRVTQQHWQQHPERTAETDFEKPPLHIARNWSNGHSTSVSALEWTKDPSTLSPQRTHRVLFLAALGCCGPASAKCQELFETIRARNYGTGTTE